MDGFDEFVDDGICPPDHYRPWREYQGRVGMAAWGTEAEEAAYLEQLEHPEDICGMLRADVVVGHDFLSAAFWRNRRKVQAAMLGWLRGPHDPHWERKHLDGARPSAKFAGPLEWENARRAAVQLPPLPGHDRRSRRGRRGQRGWGGEPGEEGRRHEDAGDYEARLRAYAAVGADEGW